MRAVALIPARGGSKRLPGKNLASIGGWSLVHHAVAQAAAAGITDIYVTTDDKVIAMEAEPFAWVIARPAELAQDNTQMMDVVRHAWRNMDEGVYDALILLQPTSPLRKAVDITACLEMLDRGAQAVVSVVETARPEVYTVGHGGRLRPVTSLMDERRVVVPNGAVFALETQALDMGLDWWTAPLVYAYEMPVNRSVDIDTQADLDLARELWTE